LFRKQTVIIEAVYQYTLKYVVYLNMCMQRFRMILKLIFYIGIAFYHQSVDLVYARVVSRGML
jgi:hypothetical protein